MSTTSPYSLYSSSSDEDESPFYNEGIKARGGGSHSRHGSNSGKSRVVQHSRTKRGTTNTTKEESDDDLDPSLETFLSRLSITDKATPRVKETIKTEEKHTATLSVPLGTTLHRVNGIVVPRLTEEATIDTACNNIQDECKICLERLASTLYQPCGHMISCIACSNQMASKGAFSCPVCREKVSAVLRMYR